MAYRNRFSNYDVNPEENKIEWNSNQAVIQRFNQIINMINFARREEDLKLTIMGLREFYDEITADLTSDERKINDKIKLLRRMYLPNTDMNGNYGVVMSEGRLWAIVDELVEELRILAKKHGYLTSNKEQDLDGL
jgi:hypothetical protein